MTNTNAYTNDYYYVNGQRTELVVEPTVYVVKFKASDRTSADSLSDDAEQFLRQESRRLDAIPHYGLQIYEVSSPRLRSIRDRAQLTEQVSRAIEELNQQESVEYASVAYRQISRSSDLMFATNRFLVQFKSTVTLQEIQEFNARYQAKIVEQLDYVGNGYIIEAASGEGAFSAIALANRYYESGLAVFAYPDFIKRRYLKSAVLERQVDRLPKTRSIYLPEQWHLTSADVVEAWTITRGAPNITVAILDDGVDLSHPEFSGKVTQQFDFAANIADGTPKSPQDKHGTACAGVAIAACIKAYGVAPNCKLMAVRTPDYLGVADEARMFKWAADNGADVISCSWGPKDGTGATDPLPDPTRAAIRYCVEKGRNGKGIPIFWAAGNGNELVSLDGYAANPDVMAIAACTSNNTKSWYSDFGAEIFITAPSSGRRAQGEKAIFTVDRRGAEGYNTGITSLGDADGDYTNDFGGTSSATPLVAGVAALLLSVNPNLSVRQVKDCLQQTTTKIGDGYNANGHSDNFGYGRVSALKAVQLAKSLSGDSTGTTPTIRAAAEILRSGSAPTFQVDPNPNRYYTVEVATRAELFDRANYASERTVDNFYASWQDTAFLSSPTYPLPIPAWERFKNSDRLFYRLWTSASNTGWLSYAVTTPDNQAASAPSILIRAAISQPNPPFIQAPSSVNRASAPTFQVDPNPNRYYTVEVTTRAELFDRANHASERTANNFYASWQDTAFLSSPTYTLPTPVWERFKNSDRLFYRLWTSASNTGWLSYAVTTPDSQAASAPSLQIVS